MLYVRSLPAFWRNITAAIFGVKDLSVQQVRVGVFCFLGLFFNPEDGNNTLL
jgi:hypothetical protein